MKVTQGLFNVPVALVMASVALCAWTQDVVGEDRPPAPRPLAPVDSSSSSSATVTKGEGGRLGVKSSESSAPSARPGFVVEAAPQKIVPRTGYYMGVFGGANLIQHGDGTVANLGSVDLESGFGGSGGVKIGYDWAFSETIDQFQDEVGGEGFSISGGLELEAYYLMMPLDGDFANGRAESTIDSGVFAINALLKLQAGQFRPYVGPGFGLVYMAGRDYSIDGVNNTNTDDDVTWAVQAIAGVDYFFKDDWSLFLEWRTLYIEEVELNSPQFRAEDYFNHVLNIGLKKHF